MIQATFNVTQADVLELSCAFYSLSATTRRMVSFIRFSFLVVGAILGIAALTAPEEEKRISGVATLVATSIIVLGFPRVYRWLLRSSAKRMLAETTYTTAYGSYQLALTEEGLISSSPIGEGKLYWSAVHSVSLTPQHLFIFFSGLQGYVVPRREVPDAVVIQMKAFADAQLAKLAEGRV